MVCLLIDKNNAWDDDILLCVLKWCSRVVFWFCGLDWIGVGARMDERRICFLSFKCFLIFYDKTDKTGQTDNLY